MCAVLLTDGFDKYGPAGQTTPAVATLLTAGEWTTVAGTYTTVAPLSTSGQALSLTTGSGQQLTRTIANTARLIGGFRFSITSMTGSVWLLSLADGASQQVSITCNASTLTFSVRTGTNTGTALATSSTSITLSSTHYLEFDITIGATASYQVWLDGASIVSGTGNTRGGTTNNYANVLGLGAGFTASNATVLYDDLYLFDTTGTTNNAPLLNNPVVETAFPSADTATKQWSNGASIIGVDNSATAATNAPGANFVFVRAFMATANMTLNSVSCVPMATSATANYRAVLYSGITAGSTLIATGTAVTGTTSGTALTGPFSTGQALTSGVAYGIGFITDTSVALQQSDTGTTGAKASNTYGSGAPATLPAMTSAQNNWQIWGNCTGSAQDYVSINMNPPIDDVSYLYSSTVGQQEMQSFPALASNPASVACVAYKARLKRSDSGTRTVEVHCASGASDSAGSTAGGITPGTSYTWVGNYASVDPATGTAWTGTGVNAATGGCKVFS